jgi:hypothetical protein
LCSSAIPASAVLKGFICVLTADVLWEGHMEFCLLLPCAQYRVVGLNEAKLVEKSNRNRLDYRTKGNG